MSFVAANYPDFCKCTPPPPTPPALGWLFQEIVGTRVTFKQGLRPNSEVKPDLGGFRNREYTGMGESDQGQRVAQAENGKFRDSG